MTKPEGLVPMIILGSGVLFAVIGAGLLIAGETLIGAIFVAVGLTDAITALVFRRRIEAGGSSGGTPAEPPHEASGEADPSYNPYARED